ncbi:MAG: hypothetical protein KH354_07680 [Clostridiales bacterium]|nr:hypothetical protein [Clostridiales bacterium]
MEYHAKAGAARKRRVKNNYCFIILFCVVFVVSIPFVVSSLKENRETEDGWIDGEESFTDDPNWGLITEEITLVPTLTPSASETTAAVSPSVPEVSLTPTEAVTPTPEPTDITGLMVSPCPEKGSFVTVNVDYFNDALFIGDSRTVGIASYGTLKNADYFARVGMTVYNVNKNATDVSGIGQVMFGDFIKNKNYKYIYIMLGLNEIGYRQSNTVKKYYELIEQIKQAQPEAVIYIQANLCITKERSDRDRYAHNSDIIKLNNALSALADGGRTVYIDVNPVFCDENYNLKSDFTGDGVHVYAKHYKTWCEWLMTKGVA